MSVLNKVEHARLIADMEHVVEVAGILPKYLSESMTQYCGPVEVDWVKKYHQYRESGVAGLILKGVHKPGPRCQAIAAAFLRNFIDARVIPLNTLLDLEVGERPSPSVLLIPNLYVSGVGKSLPAWRVQMVYDLLLQRGIHSKPTVVYVEDMDGLAKTYGIPFSDFLVEGYKEVTE